MGCVHADWGSNGGYDSDYCNIDAVDTSIDAAAYYYDSDSEEGIEFFDAGTYIYYSIDVFFPNSMIHWLRLL
jgi:hypothetical protein